MGQQRFRRPRPPAGSFRPSAAPATARRAPVSVGPADARFTGFTNVIGQFAIISIDKGQAAGSLSRGLTGGRPGANISKGERHDDDQQA